MVVFNFIHLDTTLLAINDIYVYFYILVEGQNY